MNKELALRTFAYLIGHYKTHDETIINSQEIEAINFILKDNENLEQQVKKQKEVIDNYKEDISNLLDIISKNCNELKCTSDEWLVIQKYQDKEVLE